MSKRALVGLFVVALSAAVVIGGVSAATGTTAKKQPHAHGLVGTWQATIVLPAPAPPVQSVQSYMPGGGWVETSNQDPRSRSAMLGSWQRIHGRLYAATGVHYLFNPQTGALVGKNKIDRTLEITEDGQSFAIVARVTTFDPNGNVVSTFTVHGSGQRLQVDRIPDQP